MKIQTDKIGKNITLTLIIITGLLLRLIDISKPFSGFGKWNEGHYAMTAQNFFKYGLLQPMNGYGLDLTTTPLYTWLIYISFRVFGVHEWAARLPSLIFAMASIYLTYLITERLYGTTAAHGAALFVAVSPGIAYLSRNVQLESMFTAFSLAALLFMIYYKETGEGLWLLTSGLYLSIGILTKYPAILTYPALLWLWMKHSGPAKKTEIKRMALYVILPILPALLWIIYGLETKSNLVKWYFVKPGAPWSLEKGLTAIYKAVTTYIPQHFGPVLYAAFLLTLIWALRNPKGHMAALLYTFSWALLIFMFPDFYLANWYYHYTMLYGMAILLGAGASSLLSNPPRRLEFIKRKDVVTLMALIVILTSLYQYNAVFHNYYTDFSVVGETTPFASAQLVARQNRAHEPVITDIPPTMYYLGADPSFIHLAYTTQGLIKAVKQDKYQYVVTYYMGNITLRETLETYNYSQIAPRAWHKEK